MSAQAQLAGADLAAALSAAMEQRLDMDPHDARTLATHVAEAFGGHGEVLDDELPKDLRAIFYTLEGQRILSFRREEFRNEEGHIRRAFYWFVRWEELEQGAAEDVVTVEPEAPVYEELPQDAWARV